MLTEIDYKYYQPQHADGTMAGLLEPNQAFPAVQAAIDWGEEHLDLCPENQDIEIREYCNDDIADVVIIDWQENPLPKIEDLSDDEIEDLIIETVEHDNDFEAIRMVKGENETDDQFKDRVYGEAHNLVMQAIGIIEENEEHDFSSYGGNPDTEWYDEARDGAILVVTRKLLGQEEEE